MRFLVPTLPVYILAGLWAMAQFSPAGRARVAAGATVLGVQLLWGVPEMLEQTHRIRSPKVALARVTESTLKVAEPGDVIVSSRQILDHLDYVRQWKLADLSLVRAGRMGGGPGGPGGPGGRFGNDPDAPSPMQSGKEQARREPYATLPDGQRWRAFAADVADWADGRRVYFVGTQQEMESLPYEVRVVETVAMPTPPQGGAQGGPRGMVGGMPGGVPGGRQGVGTGGPRGPFGPPGGPGAMLTARELIVAEWLIPTSGYSTPGTAPRTSAPR